MGIQFTLCDAQWSYTGYAYFCQTLAHIAGIDLSDLVDFGGTKEWPSPEEEPLVLLLSRPDDGGEFSPEECALMLRRLGDLIEVLKYDEDDYNYKKGKALLRGMRRAIKRNKCLIYF